MRVASAVKGLAAGIVLLALAGCGLSLPGRGGGDAAPVTGAIAGEAIEVSVLSESGAAAPVTAAPAEPAAPAAAPPAPAADIAAPAPAPVIPPALSAAAAACAKSGGRYGPRGTDSSYACFTTPRDAGKSCTKATDCSSACLARSLSCAPLQPLFGCHEVLTDRGARVTQCLN